MIKSVSGNKKEKKWNDRKEKGKKKRKKKRRNKARKRERVTSSRRSLKRSRSRPERFTIPFRFFKRLCVTCNYNCNVVRFKSVRHDSSRVTGIESYLLYREIEYRSEEPSNFVRIKIKVEKHFFLFLSSSFDWNK